VVVLELLGSSGRPRKDGAKIINARDNFRGWSEKNGSVMFKKQNLFRAFSRAIRSFSAGALEAAGGDFLYFFSA